MQDDDTKKALILLVVKLIGYVNFLLFLIGYFNFKTDPDNLGLLLPITAVVAFTASLVYFAGFNYLGLKGEKKEYLCFFRPFILQAVIFIGFIASLFI